MKREEGMVDRTGKRTQNATLCHNMTVTGREGWVGGYEQMRREEGMV
jgi:hypothetical protein